MVNLNKWEEVDFFDVKVGDKIKGHIKIAPTETHVVSGKVSYMSSTIDKMEGRIHVEKDGESHALIRDRNKGKIEGTTLYRRKELTQAEKDAKFEFPEKLGAIVSAVPKDRWTSTPVYHVFDGRDWSTSNNSVKASSLRRDFEDFKLVRKGITVD